MEGVNIGLALLRYLRREKGLDFGGEGVLDEGRCSV